MFHYRRHETFHTVWELNRHGLCVMLLSPERVNALKIQVRSLVKIYPWIVINFSVVQALDLKTSRKDNSVLTSSDLGKFHFLLLASKVLNSVPLLGLWLILFLGIQGMKNNKNEKKNKNDQGKCLGLTVCFSVWSLDSAENAADNTSDPKSQKYEKLAVVDNVLQKKWKLIISRCWFAKDGNEMCKDTQYTCRSRFVWWLLPFLFQSEHHFLVITNEDTLGGTNTIWWEFKLMKMVLNGRFLSKASSIL